MKIFRAAGQALLAGSLLIGPCPAAFAADSLDSSLEALSARVLDEQLNLPPDAADAEPAVPIVIAARLARALDEKGTAQTVRQREYIAALLNCGLRERARELLSRYPANESDSVIASLRYELAEEYLRRGQLDAAVELLPRAPPADPGLRLRGALITGRLLLLEQKPREAAEVMSRFLADDPVRLLSIDEHDEFPLDVLRYNLALSLLRAGDSARGRSLLDWLGSRTVSAPVSIALRDQANLSLGNLLLDQAQGATAREMYLRVGSTGAAANRALLGLGWASLAPAGSQQTRRELEVDDLALRSTPEFVLRTLRRRQLIDCLTYNRQPHAAGEMCSGDARLASSDAGGEEVQRLRSALLSWQWLIDREPDGLLVREAQLASASALAKLGESAEAVAMLQAAVDRLAIDRDRITASIGALRGGSLPLSSDSSGIGNPALVPAGEIRNRFFGDADFRRAWTSSSEAHVLAALAVDQDLSKQLTALSKRFLERATQIAIEHLQAEDHLYGQYQQVARQNLSQLLDPP